ncbi:MAG TPA: hypothetical protein VNO14_14545 [Blastocatellia bacterium]|nr:hypothetical protein [Blastocatellia bacterium]
MGGKRIKRIIEITIERSRIVLAGGRPIQTVARCPVCLKEARMITPQEASALMGMSVRGIYRSVEAGRLHFIETQQGQLYICTNSLVI